MEWMVHRPVLHHQNRLPDPGITLRKAMREVAVDHAADDPVLLHRLRSAIDVVDGAAIAQYRDAVGGAGDLVQFVGKQHRGEALGSELNETIEPCRPAC